MNNPKYSPAFIQMQENICIFAADSAILVVLPAMRIGWVSENRCIFAHEK